MNLSIYWWLLIWLFLGGLFLNNLPKRRERLNGRIVERWNVLPAILMVLPYIIWAGFRTDGADTGVYRGLFLSASSSVSDIPALFMSDQKDPGFTALMIVFKAVFGNRTHLFFLMIACVQMLCVALVFRRYSSDFWICIFLFVASTDYISWTWNGVRQFIAVCMTFAAFGLLVRRKYVKFTLVVLIAMQIHGSAVVMLPLAYIMQGKAMNMKTVLTIIITALCVVFVDRFTSVLETLMADTQYGDVMTNEIWTADNGTNIIRVIVYSVPALMAVFGRRYVIRSDDPAINQCINASFLTMAIYAVSMVTSGIYVGRLPIYTTLHGYIAMPWLIDQIFEKNSARLVKYMMIVLYTGFFFFQLYSWGSL